MWQRGLPSPHLSYFSRQGLTKLVERAGFRKVADGELKSLITKGLYSRVRADASVGVLAALITTGAALAMKAGLLFFPSDIGYFIFTKE